MARLDDYELGRVLASGGMGVVHEAVERATGRRVALKRILPGALEPEAVKRFVLEGRAVAALTHPGIVRVHALEESPGGPFMVMDLVAGISLQRVLERDGPLAPARVTAIARELARALAHAHARGVLHRDLKPANVLVDEDGAARLIDFGLAKMLGGSGSLAHLTRTGEVIGTPSFMAPEQAIGAPTDARTDVYGLGATLFALLTGSPPFNGATAVAIMYAVTSTPPTPPSRLRPGLSRALDPLVLACLAKDPAARPASMAAVLTALDAPETTAGPSSPRATIILSVVAATALVTAGAALLVRDAPRSRPPSRLSTITGPSSATAPTPPVVVETLAQAAAALLEKARARARAGDIEGALQPPSADAPAAEWLAHGRALLAAERTADAVVALSHASLAGAGREVVLARFQAAATLNPKHAPRAALEPLIRDDPRWAEGIFERELLLVRMRSNRSRPRETSKELVRLDAVVLATRLRSAAADANVDKDESRRLLREIDGLSGLAGRDGLALLLLETSELRLQLESVERAERDLSMAIELDPLLARAYHRRGRMRLLQKRHLEGAADQRRCGELRGSTAAGTNALLQGVIVLLDGEHAERALVALEEPRRRGETAATERLLGDALRSLRRDEEAIEAYERVFGKLLRGDPIHYKLAASGLEKLGREPPDWITLYLALLERDAASTPSRWLEFAASLRDDPAQAERAATGAVERGGGPDALYERAKTRSSLSRYEEALADLDEALHAKPGSAVVLCQRADVRAILGDHPGMVADFDVALLVVQGDKEGTAVVHAERSKVRERLGDLKGALEDAREAAKQFPALDRERVPSLEKKLHEQR